MEEVTVGEEEGEMEGEEDPIVVSSISCFKSMTFIFRLLEHLLSKIASILKSYFLFDTRSLSPMLDAVY